LLAGRIFDDRGSPEEIDSLADPSKGAVRVGTSEQSGDGESGVGAGDTAQGDNCGSAFGDDASESEEMVVAAVTEVMEAAGTVGRGRWT
jgi:hypothetical protein